MTTTTKTASLPAIHATDGRPTKGEVPRGFDVTITVAHGAVAMKGTVTMAARKSGEGFVHGPMAFPETWVSAGLLRKLRKTWDPEGAEIDEVLGAIARAADAHLRQLAAQ